MNGAVLPLILLGVLINTQAQILLKAGMNRVGHFDFALSKLMSVSLQVIMNPYILTGLLSYVISVVVWLLVLSRTEVSYAYPMVSLGYVLNAITAYYLFGENLSLSRIIGITIILGGVYLVARS